MGISKISVTELENIVLEIDELINGNTIYTDERYCVWKEKIKIWLKNNCDNNDSRYKRIIEIMSDIEINSQGKTYSLRCSECLKGLKLIKVNLEYLKNSIMPDPNNSTKMNEKIFIVHGHKENTKLKIKDFLVDCGLKPIVLSDQVNGGTTSLIDKFEEKAKDVSAAIILFTGDDKGASIKELRKIKSPEEKLGKLKFRARQNVVFEAGYFIGKLGRDRVVIFTDKKNIEFPGDIANTIYIPKENWKDNIKKELKDMGFELQ